jgi:membrane protease subunit (stomatin/prohibitin family)
MALLGREFIAVPDDRKQQIVYKWPDLSIRRYSKAIVNADEMALFVNTGQVVATMGPGRHDVDADELPGLGMLIDAATGGRAYRAELYFIGTREYPGNTFGGRIDDVQDPQTGMIVTLRVFGDYSLQVKDPAALITNLTGTVNVADNDAITGWVSDQLLKVMRTHMTVQIVQNGWPVLGLSAYTPQIETEVIAAGNAQLQPYGVAIVRMGNFDINLSDDDEAQLKNLARDTAYSRLAGSFNQYAAGEAALGAGQGMAKGGAGMGGAFMAAGMGAAGQAASATPGPTPPPGPGFVGGGPGFAGGRAAPAGAQAAPGALAAPGAQAAPEGQVARAGVECPNCKAHNPAGAKFCSSCGTRLEEPAGSAMAVCPNCNAENVPGARFCSSCGTALGQVPPDQSS